MSEVRGYLPPQGPRNVHGLPHTFNEGQGAHRCSSNLVIYGHPDIILTASEDAHAELERYGYEEVPEDLAEEAHELQEAGEDEALADLVAAYRDDPEAAAEPAGDEDDAQEVEDEEPAEEAPEPSQGIPPREVLEELDYRGEGSLQELAQEHDIPANQSSGDLVEALDQARGG